MRARQVSRSKWALCATSQSVGRKRRATSCITVGSGGAWARSAKVTGTFRDTHALKDSAPWMCGADGGDAVVGSLSWQLLQTSAVHSIVGEQCSAGSATDSVRLLASSCSLSFMSFV